MSRNGDAGQPPRGSSVPSADEEPEVATVKLPHANDLAALEAAFDRALAVMKMFYQPIVYAKDKRVFGYEALMRTSEPDLSNPILVIAAAERLSSLPRLGRTLRALMIDSFPADDETRGLLFVNIHAHDLLDRALMSPFSPLARLASRVVLEITEHASLEIVPDLQFRVADLRQLGYRFAIDDLGAGHSRARRLSPFDTDFVKLDISVVRDCDTHPVKQQFIASIVQLCREQGIKVIGEGVETAEEARTLLELDCDLLQGYYLARPGPPFPTVE